MLLIDEKDIMKTWDKSMEKPLVSICCLAFNHEKYIAEALDSFLRQQTTFAFEIIINDDVSIDKTVTIIKQYVEKYPHIIKPIYQQENQFSQNINPLNTFIIPASQGEYLAICDGDDHWIDDHKLQIQITKMKENPNCYMSFHPVYEKEEQHIKLEKILNRYSTKDKIFTSSEVILGRGGFSPTSSLILKRKTVENLPSWLYTTDILIDYFLQMYSSLHGGALYIDNIMSIYRVGVANSWCDIYRKNSIEQKNILLSNNKALNLFNENLDKKFQLEIDEVISTNTFSFIKRRATDISQREEIFNIYKNNFSLKQKILWYLVYKNKNIHNLFASIKQFSNSIG